MRFACERFALVVENASVCLEIHVAISMFVHDDRSHASLYVGAKQYIQSLRQINKPSRTVSVCEVLIHMEYACIVGSQKTNTNSGRSIKLFRAEFNKSM